MRSRDVRIPLFDIVRAADAIASFVEGRTLEHYETDLLLRSAVERQFEIVGEAMSRAQRLAPELAERFDDARGVVDFRNVIAHSYDHLSNRAVWDIALENLPRLREAAARMLEERG